MGVIYRGTDIVKNYVLGARHYEVLHGLNLEIEQGDFTIIAGPSGCGKSTLLFLLFGIEPPSGGEIYFNDHNLFALNAEQRTKLRRQKMSMVHQQPIWIHSLTVAENIAFPLTLSDVAYNQSLQIAYRLLEVLNLGKLAKSWATELSVGEQQRCSFLRSLIINPDIIFADEPTGNLDTDSSTVVMELFRKINEELGKTIVMVTHNLSYLPYATQTIQMIDGRIVEIQRHRPPSVARETENILDIISHWGRNYHDPVATIPTSLPIVPPAPATPAPAAQPQPPQRPRRMM